MSATLTLIDLAGDVGLLLWGTHMVTTGVLRGYGTDMRRWLGRSLDGRMKAFLVGLVVTALLQSSTATGLMATSFASSGFISSEHQGQCRNRRDSTRCHQRNDEQHNSHRSSGMPKSNRPRPG